MSFADILRAARTGPTTVMHQFRIAMAAVDEPPRVHAFVEGRDDEPFFAHQFRTYRGSIDLRIHKCGNKNEVYATRLKVNALGSSPNNLPLYFVDRDLSDILAESYTAAPDVFVSKWYAIESYLADREVFERLWRDTVRVNGTLIDSWAVASQFLASLQSFHRAMHVVMAWVIVVRRHGLKPNLNNVKLREIVAFDASLIAVRAPGVGVSETIKRLEAWTNVKSPPTCIRELRQAYDKTNEFDARHYVRGKYAAWFFVEFLLRAIESAKLVAAEVGGTVVVKTACNKENFVELCASRASSPPELVDFLRTHLP